MARTETMAAPAAGTATLPAVGTATLPAAGLATLLAVGLAAVLAALLGWGVVFDAVGSAPAPTVSVGSASGYSHILVDAQGLPLYTLNTDHGGQSTCTASCLQAWPPLTVSPGATPSAGPGVPGTLSASTQSDGRDQVTYNAMPLYTFAGDSPGNVTGQGVSGFTVVQVTPSTSSTTSTTSAGSTSATSSTPPTTVAAAASGTPQPGAAAPAGASASGAPGTSSAATAPEATPAAAATAPSGSSAPGQSATGALAATGPGPALWLVALTGLVLVALGTALALGARLKGVSSS